MEALIALGSNIDADLNLPKAMRHVAGLTEELGRSRPWRTLPHGPVEGGAFLNAVQHVKWQGDLARMPIDLT